MNIKAYVQPDGKIVIRWPKGAMPDKQTVERIYNMIRSQRTKEAVA